MKSAEKRQVPFRVCDDAFEPHSFWARRRKWRFGKSTKDYLNCAGVVASGADENLTAFLASATVREAKKSYLQSDARQVLGCSVSCSEIEN